jgi:hypothetical protein
MALSNKRRMNAVAYGEAVAKRFLTDLVEYPKVFTSDTLAEFAGGHAYDGVFTVCAWECSVQEKELAKKSCEDLIKFVLDFHKKISSLT